MNIRKLLPFGAMLATSLLAITFIQAPSASAAVGNCTWTGGGANNLSTTALNWNCAAPDAGLAPDAGDTLIFPTGVTDQTVEFDHTAGTSFNSLVFQEGGYSLSGNDYTLTNGVSQTDPGPTQSTNFVENNITMATNQTILVSSGFLNFDGSLTLSGTTLTVNTDDIDALAEFNGVISGTSGLTKTGEGRLFLQANNTYDGATALNDGVSFASAATSLGTITSPTTVGDGASLIWLGFDEATVAEPIILNGSGFDGSSLGDLGALENLQFEDNPALLTLSGPITLNTDDVTIGSNGPIDITGVIDGTGGFTFNDTDLSNGKQGVLTLSSDNTYPGMTTVNGTVIVEGSQSSPFTVLDGRTLKGRGTVGDIFVQSGGHVAPGLSPGCFSTSNASFSSSNSNFDVELAGLTPCNEYDRLVVTGTVDVSGATLNTLLLNSFKPAAGSSFTIIDNDGSEAVIGTFAGLAEGATFAIGNTIFKISYVGGTGNDVVLTVPTVPAPPNTGVQSLASPLTGLSLMAIAAGAALSRKYKLLPRVGIH